MKVLVYGAGVLGSYLAHALVRGGNDVTVLARGKRIAELQQDGLVIRHYLQRKTTVDKVNVVSVLQPDDIYDLIFVVMMYSDLEAVLPVLADNQSRSVVFVGNNADARATQNYLQEHSSPEKQIAFGFQASGGMREGSGRIICIRGGGHMDLGGLDGDLSWRPLLEKAFENARYKLVFYADFDPWLKSHIIVVMVLGYATYAYDGDLRKITRDMMGQIVGALDEGYSVLEAVGYTVTPASQAQFIRKRRRLVSLFLRIYAMTPIHRLTFSPSQLDEFVALNNAFDALKQKVNILTPNWDALERYTPVS